MAEKNIEKKITDALFSLMKKKDYKSISITDIVNEAGLSRVTYYRHFSSKEEIIIKFFQLTKNDFINRLGLNSPSKESNYEVTILGLFLFFKSNISINKCLKEAGLENELLKFLTDEFMTNLPVKLDKYMACFVAGALYNVLIHWLDSDCKDPIDEVSKPFIEIQNFVREKSKAN